MNKLKFSFILITAICAVNFGFAQVGINTTTPLSTLDINGNLSVKEIGIVNALVPGSAVFIGGAPGQARPINDGIYISLTPVAVSGSNGPEFLLPNATNFPGRIYIIRNITPFGAYPPFNAQIYSAGGLMFPKNSNADISPVIMETTGFRKTLFFVSDGVNWTFFE